MPDEDIQQAAALPDYDTLVREKDTEIETLRSELRSAYAAAQVIQAKVEADMQATIDARDAEITTLRQGYDRARIAVYELRELLAKANNPVHGIEAPRKIEDLPSLDQIPPHASIDAGQAIGGLDGLALGADGVVVPLRQPEQS